MTAYAHLLGWYINLPALGWDVAVAGIIVQQWWLCWLGGRALTGALTGEREDNT